MDNDHYTPLYGEHLKLKALMAPFGGFIMPIQYTGILNEHSQCRKSASLFDICHMGEFYFKGDAAGSGLDRLTTVPLTRLAVGKCKYGFMLKDDGCIIDDLIVYRLSGSEFMIVVNSATSDKDFSHIKKNLRGGAVFMDVSPRTAKLDLQGPLSRDVAVRFFGGACGKLPYFSFMELPINGVPSIISRTGYTGELGFEIYTSSENVKAVWNLLLSDERVRPAGLGARDILRLEMGYSLYGSDIDDKTTPVEAGLDAFIDFNRNFAGRNALLEQKKTGPKRAKVAFITASRRSPRHNYRIISHGTDSGEVTSGAFSPMLGAGIGLGYVRPEDAVIGSKVILKQDHIEIEAEITGLPFYKGGSLRK